MNKILLLLLALSIGFNVFFAAGYLRARREFERMQQRNKMLQTFEGRCQLFIEKLDLDLQQRGVFEQLLKEFMEKNRTLAEEQHDELERFLQEIVKDKPDPLVTEDYINNPRVFEQRRIMVEQLLEFMRYLSPEQRRELANTIRASRAK